MPTTHRNTQADAQDGADEEAPAVRYGKRDEDADDWVPSHPTQYAAFVRYPTK